MQPNVCVRRLQELLQPTSRNHLAAPVIIACLAVSIVGAQQSVARLSDAQIHDAIEFGKTWKSADKFLEDGLKPYKFKIAGVMSTDGTTKYVTVLTDWTTIAAASADAHRRLRELAPEEISGLPNTGLIQVVAEMHARGLIAVHRMQGRYGGDRTHVVIKFGETVVQPIERSVVSDTTTPAYHVLLVTSTVYGNLGWVLAPASGDEEKVVARFVFNLSPEQRQSRSKVILIDGNGSQDAAEIDFSKLK